MPELTPMMQQYTELKNQYPDTLLFFRLGDFYEMFFDDAKLASRELELTLTGRDCGQEERAPMCGVPHHSCDAYIAKLVQKGYKVAICEQMEDPATAVGLVKRDIIRIITPGTVLEGSMLEDNKNNYIAAVYRDTSGAGVCFADISTGEFAAAGLSGNDLSAAVNAELAKYAPKEIVMNDGAYSDKEITEFAEHKLGAVRENGGEWRFVPGDAKARVQEQFQNLSEDELENAAKTAISAAGALLSYLHETQKSAVAQINKINFYECGSCLELDIPARRNLELCETLRARERRGSLLWVLDKTRTAMGGRLIRRWLEAPLINPTLIKKRQNAVAELYSDTIGRSELSDALSGVYDLERLTSRIVSGSANARDLVSVAAAISALPGIKARIGGCQSALLADLNAQLDPLDDIGSLITRAIVDEPPVSVHDGGVIRDGFDPEVDKFRFAMTHGKDMIAGMEAEERVKTGIKNLKIGYNKVFGYYIEISRGNIAMAPESYIRKQTLTNCERYITQELKDLETTVLNAQERISGLEYELFESVRSQIASHVLRIQKTARAVAELDVLASLGEVAAKNNYICPDVDLSDVISITDGRHPVVERLLKDALFVPNNTLLDNKDNRVAVITGPNMAGKSTYMRQIALIVVMAQMGGFVPARAARIGVVDKIFTRVGASDDLGAGQSTFMVEMSEVASILKNATSRSLIILDEIGRGTSTFDGMSIARAVLEFVADKRKLGAKTVFATHYHELTALEDALDGVKNYNISVKKRGDDITFLRKIVRGGADDSYGIEVAKLAGIPNPVIKRAKEILQELEREKGQTPAEKAPDGEDQPQMMLGDVAGRNMMEKLKSLDVNTLTPLEALNMLYEFAKSAEEY